MRILNKSWMLLFFVLTACSASKVYEPICSNPKLVRPTLEKIENDRSHLRNYTKLIGAIYTRDGIIERCTN